MTEAASAAADGADWTALAAPRLASEFCQAWLTLQCRFVPGAEVGLLLLREDDGSFAPAAAWPQNSPRFEQLVPIAERALRERQGVAARADSGASRAAYPVVVHGQLWGVAVLEAAGTDPVQLQDTVRHLHWGAGWLESLFHRRAAEQDEQRIANAQLALDTLAAAGEAVSLHAAAAAIATELAIRLSCRRVAIGIMQRGHARVVGLSHTAILHRRLQLASSLANAMEEAADQAATTAWPGLPGTTRAVAVAHRDHAKQEQLTAVLSVVTRHARQPSGVIVLERDDGDPFDGRTQALAEAVASLLGPYLALHQALARPLAGSVPAAFATAFRALFGRRHPTVKLAAAAAAAVIGWLVLATGEDRISGKATLTGEEVRAATAPFDGYVATAPRRAGDIVADGEVLATLDTRDAELEAVRYESQRDQALLKAQDADGKHDRTEAGINRANAAEAQAQLDAARDKLARATLRAPFGGIVVSGDLSQQLAAPVERGKVLFEVAPLGRYRVEVQADEREIARIHPGQPGRLLLNGLSDEVMPFTITKVVPVAVAGDGRNTFRVEGAINVNEPRLRPGMEGIGKIVVGQARLLWVYGHPIVDWVRINLWKYWP